MAKLVSKVYGDALFSLAVENDRLDSVWEEVKTVNSALSENPEFISTLTHPEMTEDGKKEIIRNIFSKEMSEDMMGFFDVLIKKGRIGDIGSIFTYFDERAKEEKGIGVVQVSTPAGLSADEKKKIEDRILEVTKYSTLETHYNVDRALLGGIVIRIGDRVLDNSIRTKLTKMSRELLEVKL